jgi:hypothetical protein
MDRVFDTYSALLIKGAPPKIPRRGFVIVLYANQQDYLKAGQPPAAGAYYKPQTQELVGFYHPIVAKPYFAHEGIHQFTDLTVPTFRSSGVPMWFIEGIADCIGNSVERDGKLYMCSLSGVIATLRLPTIAQLVREQKHVPLADLVTMDRRAFMADASAHYAQAWSFCHFLMTYPKREEPTRQIPDGKYRKVVSAFYESLLNRKTSAADAWKSAMAAGSIASLEALEEEWKRYVLEIARPDPDCAYLGVKMDGVRADTGALISGTAPGSPAEKAGLLEGDVVVRFDGRPVEFWNDFLATLRTKKPGDKVVLTVKREGKEVDQSVQLERRGEGR